MGISPVTRRRRPVSLLLALATSAGAMTGAVTGATPAIATPTGGGSDVLTGVVAGAAGLGTAQPVALVAAAPEALGHARRQVALAERTAAQQRASRAKARALADPKAYARTLVTQRGWSSEQFRCLDALWMKESEWIVTADNPTSSAYGIPQALPGQRMASHGSDWRTNPATQIRWGLDYIADRYGTPCEAWAHSRATNWY